MNSRCRPKRLRSLEKLSVSFARDAMEDATGSGEYKKNLRRIMSEFSFHSSISGSSFFANGVDMQTTFILRQVVLSAGSSKLVIDGRTLSEPAQFADL